MPVLLWLRKWLRLPSGIALLLGIGALTATGAKPALAEPDLGKGPVRGPQQSAKSFGEVRIWSERDRIYFSESGNEPQELRLGDTPEARRLKQLLAQDGAAPNSPRLLPHRLILVGGGGAAVHWGGGRPSRDRDSAGSAKTGRDSNTTIDPRTRSSAQGGSTDNRNVAGVDPQK